MEAIKTLIIDDNPFILDMLSDMLDQGFPGLQVVSTASNATDGIQKIQTFKPELIFLDVEMPDMSGFEMLAQLDKINFQTIFITSFSHYAIKAIRFNALDYLLKPVQEGELGDAMKRYIKNRNETVNQQKIQQTLDNLKKEKPEDQTFVLHTQSGELRILLKKIVHMEGERNYSYIYLSDGSKVLSSKTLGYFDELLSEKGFCRIHRSHLVNGFHIEKISKQDNVVLKNKLEIPISRRKKSQVIEWFFDYSNDRL
jgi:two-component system LytT family response regulator